MSLGAAQPFEGLADGGEIDSNDGHELKLASLGNFNVFAEEILQNRTLLMDISRKAGGLIYCLKNTEGTQEEKEGSHGAVIQMKAILN